MSDVSGIPYMGPMGQGNFFAPQFSYNPQINPTAGYAGPSNYYQQGVMGPLLQNTQASINRTGNLIAASQLATGGYVDAGGYIPYAEGGNRNFTTLGNGPLPGLSSITSGDYGSPAWTFTNPSDRPAYNAPWDYSGSSFNLPAYNDWSTFQSPTSDYNLFQGGGGNIRNNLNLGAGGTPEWSTLFPSDGSRADPYPGMTPPGGLGQPMTLPPQTASEPFSMPSESKQGVGGANYQGPGSGLDWSTLWGGDKTAAAPQQPQEKSQDRPVSETSQGTDRGLDPNYWTEVFGGRSPSTDYKTFQGPGSGASGGGGLDTDVSSANKTAAQLAEDARARLSGIIGSPETAKVAEEAAKEGRSLIPYHRSSQDVEPTDRLGRPLRPEENAPRPPATVGKGLGFLEGRSDRDLKNVRPDAVQATREFARLYNASQDKYDMVLRAGEGRHTEGQHTRGEALDFNLIDRRTGQRLNDYQTRDPVVFSAYQDHANQFHQFLEQNYPKLAATHRWGGYFSGGVGTYGAQDIMHHDFEGGSMAGGSWKGGLGQAAADYWQLPTGGGTKTPWPQFNLFPNDPEIPPALSYKSPSGTRVYQQDPITGERYYPAMGGKHNLGQVGPYQNLSPGPPRPPGDVPIAGAAPPGFADMSKPSAEGPVASTYWKIPDEGTPEWNQQVYEGRRGLGGISPRGPETVSGLEHFTDFRPSENVIDRRNENLGRDELTALKARGTYYPAMPDTAPITPLGSALGLETLRNTPLGPGGAFKPGETLPRVIADPFDAGYNEIDAMADQPSMANFPSPSTDYGLFQQDPSYQYRTMEPRIGAGMQRQFEDYPGDFTPQVQQRQLQQQNAQNMQALESNPAQLDNVLGMMLGEAGRGANASEERIMLAETIFNRAAQTGQPIIDVLNSGRTNPRGYYPDSWRNMPGNLEYLNSHPEVREQLLRELRTAGYGGSTLSNLATHNASRGVGAHVPSAAVAAFGPVNQETFYNKSFPYSTTGVYQGDPTSTLRWYNQNAPIGQNTYGPLPGSVRVPGR